MNKNKAVVLLNMGGPNSLHEVKVFLQNMFNDPYILSIKSDFMRKMVANFIVNKRLEESQNNYKQIGGKSPLVAHTFSLCEKLNAQNDEYYFTYAMRYTPPFAKMVAFDLMQKGFEEIILFSMYPHFSYTTFQSSYEDFLKALQDLKYQPKIKVVKNYYFKELYNQVILKKIKESLGNENAEEFHLIFSAHSLPQRNIDRGDPYQKEILENVEILKQLLIKEGLKFSSIKVAYQSKIGPIKWLEPNLQNLLKSYKDKNLIIYPIAFSMDNSETDFELSLQYKQEAHHLGIKDFRVCQCLNDDDDFAKFILEQIKEAK
ncbi:ferrochelatase [Helicobacter valdiviensis]|uniref:Ferrochelatase n=1 Tax=Helicobacter valdiviensis TaxID=1458358 RepID=A0A2W6MSI7_9HELI|nr:ferrochelatase [Helicobacter valdiviensis]PZT47524.1 ferrochelatase [Helicobacter valdiviensis]